MCIPGARTKGELYDTLKRITASGEYKGRKAIFKDFVQNWVVLVTRSIDLQLRAYLVSPFLLSVCYPFVSFVLSHSNFTLPTRNTWKESCQLPWNIVKSELFVIKLFNRMVQNDVTSRPRIFMQIHIFEYRRKRIFYIVSYHIVRSMIKTIRKWIPKLGHFILFKPRYFVIEHVDHHANFVYLFCFLGASTDSNILHRNI